MKRGEREELIERYLQGKLTAAEENDFFIEVATDRELQYELKASQVVESAIRKDRINAPTNWSATRAELAAMLTGESELSSESESAGRSTEPSGSGGSAGKGLGFARLTPGWILTGALFLISITALLLSLVAIDRTTVETGGTTPAEELPINAEQTDQNNLNNQNNQNSLPTTGSAQPALGEESNTIDPVTQAPSSMAREESPDDRTGRDGERRTNSSNGTSSPADHKPKMPADGDSVNNVNNPKKQAKVDLDSPK